MIKASIPAIVCSCGNTAKEAMKNITNGAVCLEESSEFSKQSYLFGMCHNLMPLPESTPFELQIRTNTILYNCLLQIDSDIRTALSLAKNVGIVIGTTTTGVEENYKALRDFDVDFYTSTEVQLTRESTSESALESAQDSANSNTKFCGYVKARSSLYNPSAFIRQYYGIDSLCFGVSSACTSGNKAIIEGARLINSNLCDVVICGAVDGLSTLSINGFLSLDILSHTHTNPMSSNRNGINIGEGGAIFLLYSDEIARALGIKTFCIKGWASNNDAFHITQPSASLETKEILLNQALSMANLTHGDIDYINLHGTGTSANDSMESNLIARYFSTIPASSTKPLMGHCLGAAGAIECAICALLVMGGGNNENTLLPPHMYDGTYDSSLRRINLVDKNHTKTIKNALSLSFAFGGDNSVIVIGDSV